ncbi:MAG TPA: hypothetical protein VGP47_11525 [Parachlamydiaceae bacterium]|nr:hypothetical protein [Parachlamydiaceae bacterium]
MNNNMNSISGTGGKPINITDASDVDALYGPSSAPKKSSETIDAISGALKSVVDSIHQFGIFVTGAAPFSSRGLFFNLAISPIRIPIRLIQSAQSDDFSKTMKEHMNRDFNQGIQDFYIDLEGDDSKTVELRTKVLTENMQYSLLMSRNERGVQTLSDKPTTIKGSSNEERKKIECLNKIQDRLINEMGFKYFNEYFYHLESGSMFNVNILENELVFCFPGIGNEEVIQNEGLKAFQIAKGEDPVLDDSDLLVLTRILSIGVEHLGGLSFAATQAIELGKMVKEATKESGLTPVMVGHSHGGATAQCAAVANGLKAVVFNSRPMGAGTRRYIGQSTVAENASKITAFSGKDDWLSGNKALNVLSVLFERVTGIPVPRTVGVGYHLPELGESDEGEMKVTPAHIRFQEGMDKLDEMKNTNNDVNEVATIILMQDRKREVVDESKDREYKNVNEIDQNTVVNDRFLAIIRDKSIQEIIKQEQKKQEQNNQDEI